MAADEIEVEAGEKLGGAPAAAGAKDGGDGGIGEGGVEVGEALLDRAGVVDGTGGEGVRKEDGFVAEGAEMTHAGADTIRTGGGGWRDDRDAGAGLEGWGLEGHAVASAVTGRKQDWLRCLLTSHPSRWSCDGWGTRALSGIGYGGLFGRALGSRGGLDGVGASLRSIR